jgi:hypothetical protein
VSGRADKLPVGRAHALVRACLPGSCQESKHQGPGCRDANAADAPSAGHGGRASSTGSGEGTAVERGG